MRTLVDLDGVAAGWGHGYDTLAEQFGLLAEGGMLYHERTTWDLRQGLTERGLDITRQIMEYDGFYRNLPVIDGAQDAIERLQRTGHDVWFVSTPYLSNPSCANDKLAWVEEHFGPRLMAKTILTMDKTVVIGDVLIDDRPEISGVQAPTWKHLCFGEYGYSATTQSERVKTWYDVETTIMLLQWERDLTNTKVVG